MKTSAFLTSAAFAAMLAWVGGKGREFRLGKHAFWLPDARTVLLVTGISVVELGLAGGALYVLLPGVPGTVVVEADASSTLDRYRGRG